MEPREKKQKHICKFGKTCKTLDNRYPPTKKFGRIKRKLCEFTLISEENCRGCFAPMGTAGYIFEKERQLNQYSHMIHPYSKFRQFWEGLVILETLVSVLIRLFVVSQYDVNVFLSLEYQIPALLVDLFEMTDTALEFVTGYVDRETNDVILEAHQVILHNFQKVSFYPSFISALPFEFSLYLLQKVPSKCRFSRYVIYIKIFRLIKTYRYLVHTAKIYNWSELIYRIVLISYNLMVLVNWLSCLFYMVIFSNDFGPSHNSLEKNDALFRHLIIFHMISSVLFVKNGLLGFLIIKSAKDMFFSAFVLLVAAIVQAISFGFFIQLYCFKKSSLIYYEELLQETQKFIAQENLPKHIHKKINQYFEFRFRGRYFREKSILETVSPPLRKEIAYFLCHDLLAHPESIFKDIPTALAMDLCLYVKHEVFLPGDDVIREGKKATKIYFISCGSFGVYSSRGTEIKHLYNGAQFGEAAFGTRNQHPVTVLALEMSECYSLKYENFVVCTTKYPEYAAKVTRAADSKRKFFKKLIEVAET